MADSVPKDRPLEPITDPRLNTKPLDYKEQFQGAMNSQFVDPCKAAHKASLKCLDRNNYERIACEGYFQAYRDCKKAWTEQRKAERRAGIYKD
ncbi:hypothetical protein BD626DRAFT_488326 [Schizophyllum amplum]|uniref:Cytochrome c oxidase-assembly factor COX23, mitochondrial n=1 Tax=Schizophyllum amplum TaxID=97359 RepID=A0A550CKH3_9AGAR|nr:hypothetical protein BD626DRAFT_488326 [Auriculariopsis ampla]